MNTFFNALLPTASSLLFCLSLSAHASSQTISQTEIEQFNERLQVMDNAMAEDLKQQVETISIDYMSQFGYTVEIINKPSRATVQLSQTR